MPTGAPVKVPGTGVYEYDSVNRQITAARIYFDMATLLQLITDSVDDRPSAMAALQKAEEALQSNGRKMSLIINTIPSCARASCTRLERPGGDGA